MSDNHDDVVRKLVELYRMLLCHDGFGEMHVDIRILKRGQKEVVLRCGKQYRFVVDMPEPGMDLEECLAANRAGASDSSGGPGDSGHRKTRNGRVIAEGGIGD